MRRGANQRSSIFPETVKKRAQAAARKRWKRRKNQKCQRCHEPAPKLDRHHPDYRLPLKKRWVCPKCHATVDRHRKAAELRRLKERIPDNSPVIPTSSIRYMTPAKLAAILAKHGEPRKGGAE